MNSGSGVQTGGLGAGIAGQIVRAEIGQFDLETLDIQPECAPTGEDQDDATARRLGGMEFDAEQFQRDVGRFEIDIAGLAGQHAVEAQRRDQPARRDFPEIV